MLALTGSESHSSYTVAPVLHQHLRNSAMQAGGQLLINVETFRYYALHIQNNSLAASHGYLTHGRVAGRSFVEELA